MVHSEESKETEKPIGVGKKEIWKMKKNRDFLENIDSVTRGLVDLRSKLKQISNNQHMRVEINSAHGDSKE
jgi:hypothetical protein